MKLFLITVIVLWTLRIIITLLSIGEKIGGRDKNAVSGSDIFGLLSTGVMITWAALLLARL